LAEYSSLMNPVGQLNEMKYGFYWN